ncbi:hypothetical protein [Larkinella humicola]|uniref:Uncharacterized protein n=1 Tax=Larkinella humicola TaxID=2607654 RepID=A0A5N1JNS6_9BACT|nr:hypothetical protein [Larkinella humicola]KAA9357276.1 hypothetical protein F0P93_05940 [Larkinella humicola]
MESNEVKQAATTGETMGNAFTDALEALCAQHGIKQFVFGGIDQGSEAQPDQDEQTHFTGMLNGSSAFCLQAIPCLISRLSTAQKGVIAMAIIQSIGVVSKPSAHHATA